MRNTSKKPHYFLVDGGGWGRVYGGRIVIDKEAESAQELHKIELGIFGSVSKKAPHTDSVLAGGRVLLLKAKKLRGVSAYNQPARDKAGRFARAAA